MKENHFRIIVTNSEYCTVLNAQGLYTHRCLYDSMQDKTRRGLN